jgi:hypothetical protein
VSVIALALIAAQATEITELAPDVFRRQVALHHMCITDQPTESGYKEIGLLYLDAGENLPNVTVTAKDRAAFFEKGIVTAVKIEKSVEAKRWIASMKGERQGRPAQLQMTLTRKTASPGMGVDLNLSENGKDTRFRCMPDIRKVTQ